MLNATLHRHLENYDSSVSGDMKDNIYFDNVTSGYDQEPDTVHYYEEAIAISARFNLCSRTSNSSAIHQRTSTDGTADANTVVNIIGLKWNPSNDTLGFMPSKDYPPQPCVKKREILQMSFKTYDPLGLLSPELQTK